MAMNINLTTEKWIPLFVLIVFWSIGSFAQTDDRNQSLIAILDTVYQQEQVPIRTRDELMEKFGTESKEAQVYQKIYKENHAINEQIVTRILDDFGWLGVSEIGEQGNRTLYLVIQHSAVDVRQKYLPMLQNAVKNGNAPPRFLANVQDRISTDLGELQAYGEQMKFYPESKSFNVWPVMDPANIDVRRAEIGLGPIADHLKNRFNFDWDLEEQLKRTADFENDMKKE